MLIGSISQPVPANVQLDTDGRLGLATLCIGVGMGLALAVERV